MLYRWEKIKNNIFEMTRDIAMKFNQQYGVELFKLPEPLILDSVAVIPGTDGQNE